MTPAPADNSLPKQLDTQAVYYDVRIRNQKVLRKNTPNSNKPSIFDDF